jgi:hypothetical protein
MTGMPFFQIDIPVTKPAGQTHPEARGSAPRESPRAMPGGEEGRGKGFGSGEIGQLYCGDRD